MRTCRQKNEKHALRSTTFFFEEPKEILKGSFNQFVFQLDSKRRKSWRENIYDEIQKDIIRSIQEFEDDDISEWSGCLYDYSLDHEDIILQRSTFDFSNEHCFDKCALDHIAKLLQYTHVKWGSQGPEKICPTYVPVNRKSV